MTNDTRHGTNHALGSGFIDGSRAQDFAGLLYGAASTLSAAIKARIEGHARQKRRLETELLLNNLPEATRRDINWPARRREIYPGEDR